MKFVGPLTSGIAGRNCTNVHAFLNFYSKLYQTIFQYFLKKIYIPCKTFSNYLLCTPVAPNCHFSPVSLWLFWHWVDGHLSSKFSGYFPHNFRTFSTPNRWRWTCQSVKMGRKRQHLRREIPRDREPASKKTSPVWHAVFGPKNI